MGRELRLRQQYFFVSASLQDILYRFCKSHDGFDELPDKVAIQLNDTHPSIAVPELMRILVDIRHLEWDKAWDLTTRTFKLHQPHADVGSPGNLAGIPVRKPVAAPFADHLRNQPPLHEGRDAPVFPATATCCGGCRSSTRARQKVRMAHLAIVGSHKVNGVARIHSELMRQTIFADFHRLSPDKIINMTNGSPRGAG